MTESMSVVLVRARRLVCSAASSRARWVSVPRDPSSHSNFGSTGSLCSISLIRGPLYRSHEASLNSNLLLCGGRASRRARWSKFELELVSRRRRGCEPAEPSMNSNLVCADERAADGPRRGCEPAEPSMNSNLVCADERAADGIRISKESDGSYRVAQRVAQSRELEKCEHRSDLLLAKERAVLYCSGTRHVHVRHAATPALPRQ